MEDTRAYWIRLLEKISFPVLRPLSERKLREALKPDLILSVQESTAPLEAFGRTLLGISPWLAARDLPDREAAAQSAAAALSRRALAAAVIPDSPDRMNFLDQEETAQPIVDAAFLAAGLLRAWGPVWERSDGITRTETVAAMKGIRRKKPCYTNWLLFSAMVECFLYRAGEDFDEMRVDYALNEFCRHWYTGDGLYGDGEDFHLDYYNSYVIHPLLLLILDTVGDAYPEWAALRGAAAARLTRYAHLLEKLIAPDGSFPVIGRSVCYRMGAFYALGDAALRGVLPEGLSPAAVRCAVTAVMRRCTDAPANFREDGFLTVGLCGGQPSLREPYINTGSLYHCMAAFAPLGLPPSDPFWSLPDEDWSSRKIWSGLDYPADHAFDG